MKDYNCLGKKILMPEYLFGRL